MDGSLALQSGVVGELRDAAAGVPLNSTQLAALAVGILLLVAVGTWAVTRLFRKTPGEELSALLAERDAVTVLMHPNPDPDAMAAAFGVAHIADRTDTGTRLCYPGQIRHQENRAFRTILELDLDSIEAASEIETPVVLVDHNEPRGIDDCETIDPIAVVDHHPGEGTGSAFTDCRPEYGACATIVTEYLQDVAAPPQPDDDDPTPEAVPSSVATGLLYGILSDTSHLTNGCHAADFTASSYLFPGVDSDELDRIANPDVDEEVLEIKAAAITGRDVRGSYAVADVGTVSNVDAIPQAADELLRLEGVTAVVVFGDREGVLHLSGRSRDDRVHMGDALALLAEPLPDANAGGHARMGGGQFPVEQLDQEFDAAGTDRAVFKDQLFDALDGDV
jgi:nanoRNase/pAp phosphatase (c-di-AMP/oligoRNAs hydrolase)